MDAIPILQKPSESCKVYADVLAFPDVDAVKFSLDDYATVEIVARVLTADRPVNLNITTKANGTADEMGAISIYVAVLDQPISISVNGKQSTTLELGSKSPSLGATISFDEDDNGQLLLLVSYTPKYIYDDTALFQSFLDTELRIGLALFWARPAIALSICDFVARITHDNNTGGSHSLSNAQAVALGQQLAAHAMATAHANYAPTLKFDDYHGTMLDQLAAAQTFEDEYKRFQDREASTDDQKTAWQTMLDKAQGQRVTRVQVQDQTLAKYDDAKSTVEKYIHQLDDDNDDLRKAKDAFDAGLLKWENAQILKAVFSILKAIFG